LFQKTAAPVVEALEYPAAAAKPPTAAGAAALEKPA
jgi:hypothetical protein